MTDADRARAREDFINQFRHHFGGMVLDAATAQRTGAALAMSIRFVMKDIDKKLAEAFDMLVPPASDLKGKK